MVDAQEQFALANFQPRLESLHPLLVHAINAKPCDAKTNVMLVTVCLRKASYHEAKNRGGA